MAAALADTTTATARPAGQDLDGVKLGFTNAPEQREPIKLAVEGTFPSWLSGTLWRQGLDKYEVPPASKGGKGYSISHWFDGLGMLHAFQLDGATNTVHYRSRYTTDEFEVHARDNPDSIIRFHRNPDPCKRLYSKLFTTFKNMSTGALRQQGGKSSANVSVTVDPSFAAIGTIGLPSQGGKEGVPLVTRTDANQLGVLDPETLEPLRTLSYTSLHPDLRGPLSAAHGVGIGDDYYNYVLDFGARPTYRVFRLGAVDPGTGKPSADVLATITDLPGAYLHSLAATERYVILSVWESDYAWAGIKILTEANLVRALKPWAGRKCHHVVIDRKAGGIVARYESPSIFVFHHVNAFDRPSADGSSVDVVLDLAAWGDNRIIYELAMDRVPAGRTDELVRQANYPVRVVLPAADKAGPNSQPRPAQVHGDQSLTRAANIELPVVNPSLAWTRPSRFTYGIHRSPDAHGVLADSIIKLDMDALESSSSGPSNSLVQARWDGDEAHGLAPGEPIFIATPPEAGGTGAEDDGVLLIVCLDSHARHSVLYAVDARTMETVARARVDGVVPFGFHGAFKARF